MQLKIIYLARLRDALGCSSESLELADGGSLGAVRAALRERGGPWARELADGRSVRIAVNHELTAGDVTLQDGDEIAFFPPVTGG
jgi:molybdopterin synthase sulfur carrier subunit